SNATPIALVPVPSGGAVSGLAIHTTPGSSVVTVTWDQLPNGRWNGGTTNQYAVTVDAPNQAVLDPNTCTTVSDSAHPSCSFTTDKAGDYRVKVVAVNEAGPSLTFSQQQQHVTLGAPSGHVAGLTVQTTAGSGVVNVSWTALPDANWNDAATRTYRVTVVDPAGDSTHPGTCDVVADTQSPSCSFTTATAGSYTVH